MAACARWNQKRGGPRKAGPNARASSHNTFDNIAGLDNQHHKSALRSFQEREHPAAVTYRLRHVVFPRAPNAGSQRFIPLPHHPPRHPHHERPRRNHHPLPHHRARGDHAPRPHHHVVEENAAHPDQAVLLDGAPVDDGAVADPYPGPDAGRLPFVYMNNGAVLNVRALAHHDRSHVPPQDAPIPDAGLGPQRDVPQHRGTGSDVGRGMEAQFCLLGTNGCWTQASTGVPALSAGVQTMDFDISIALVVMLSTFDGENNRDSMVWPSADTWTYRIASRGTSGASAGRLMNVATVGRGGVSKHSFRRLYSGPGSAQITARDGGGFGLGVAAVPAGACVVSCFVVSGAPPAAVPARDVESFAASVVVSTGAIGTALESTRLIRPC